jgi:hypothetical protein
MGRTKFKELEKHAKGVHFQHKSQDIYLFGSSGAGKSHILAAFVIQLIQEGKKVVYLPDCNNLIRNFEKSIRTALYFAFYGDPEACTAIECARGVDDLLEFSAKHTDKYLVVDQLNALESGCDDVEAKRQVRAWLLNMAADHRYIYSASANLRSSQDIKKRQDNIAVIQFYGPMDEVCCTHPSPTLSGLILWIGRNKKLVRSLCS